LGLLREFHGRGYATEAGNKARDYAFADLGWKTAVSYMHPQNIASRRVAERMGAVFEKEIQIAPGTAMVYRHPRPQ
jgi:RimJ/RimL family protein N-acetyltransferase